VYTASIMRPKVFFPLMGAFILWANLHASADDTLILKNGQRITVPSYREESGVVRFYRFGGEIGISKEQIQSIQKTTDRPSSGLTLSEADSAAAPAAPQAPSQDRAVSRPTAERPPSAEEERAKEEKEYQQKLAEVTSQLKDIRDRYSQSTRGTTSRDPSLMTSEEEIKRLNEDAASRLKDAQNNPVDPGVIKLTTPSPFSSLGTTTTDLRPPAPSGPTFGSPPPYTEREKELSDLRNQAIQLEREREKLIDEMRQKNFATGSLFPE
jgi:hypothetical protein